MSKNGSNYVGGNVGTSSLLPPKSKNVVRNITNIGWKHETHVLGNGKM